MIAEDGRVSSPWQERIPHLGAPFTGLSAQRCRPAVHGGSDAASRGSVAPFTGLLGVRLEPQTNRWLKPNPEKPGKPGSGKWIVTPVSPAVNGGPTPLRGKPPRRGLTDTPPDQGRGRF